jgi:hypothetical protein
MKLLEDIQSFAQDVQKLFTGGLNSAQGPEGSAVGISPTVTRQFGGIPPDWVQWDLFVL